jgi:p-hydroxybenzoate 3-monooxygenase
MRTQVAIIGAGPAGMLLSHLLARSGVDSVVVERQSREHVLGRIRAGVLEWGTVDVLRQADLAARMDAEGAVHDTINIAVHGTGVLSLDSLEMIGARMMAYGQTSIQEDLFVAADARGAQVFFEATDVTPLDLTTTPAVTFHHDGEDVRIDCDLVAGCDGYHGVSRQAIPPSTRTEYDRSYGVGWLGILSETPPLPIVLYATHERGFALCSMRSPHLSRYYVQCPLEDTVDDWSDDRFWSELLARLPAEWAEQVASGPSIEKSVAPIRAFVCEPLRYGSLFLAGDAGHIVPPTGAKGLNLAVSDVYYLHRAFVAHYRGDDRLLDAYSDTALRRVWGATRFSLWMTELLHRLPDRTPFAQRIQDAELANLKRSRRAQKAFCEQYTGLPLHDDTAGCTTDCTVTP